MALSVMAVSSIANASELKLSCLIDDNPNVISFSLNSEKTQIIWGGDEKYEIFQITDSWVTAYRKTDHGTGVGGEVMVFNTKTKEALFSGLVHYNYPEGTNKIVSSNYRAQCK